jgi:tetratricopeptide (TPR) repeat protein
VEYKQNAWKEIVLIGEKIITECRDNNIRQDIIEVMTYAYKYLGENEKAVKLINEHLGRFWVSRERMLEIVLEGNELTKQCQSNLMTLTDLSAGEMRRLSESFEPKDKLTVLENIISLYSMVFMDGDYGYYHIALSNYHIEAMNIYLDLGNNVKVFEHLKKASELSIAYDNLPFQFKHTSPLVNKMICGQLIKNYKGNQSYNLLKHLEEEKYNNLRDMSEFTEICESLKKHAKEDS